MSLRRGITILAIVAGATLLAGLFVSGSTAAEDPEIAFAVEGPTDVAVGTEATYTVRVVAPVELYSAEVQIQYPSEVARITAVEDGDFLRQDAGSLVAAAGAEDGAITYAESRSSTDKGIVGEGILVSFTVEFTSSGTHEFAFADAQARDPKIAPIETSTNRLAIEVAGGEDDESKDDGAQSSENDSGIERSEGDSSDDQTEETDSGTEDNDEWPPVVADTVRHAFENAERVPVMATTDEPEELADRIRERGGDDITVLSTASVVAFTGNAELVRWVADREDVTLIQYDETVATHSSITVKPVTIEPDEPEVNTPVTVEVRLRNGVPTELTEDITLTVGGEIVEARTVTLDANTNETVIFTFTPEEPGDYPIAINDRTATALSVTADDGTPTPTEQSATEPTNDDVPGFTGGLAVVALFGLLFASRHRKS